jgi:hypothetical protein
MLHKLTICTTAYLFALPSFAINETQKSIIDSRVLSCKIIYCTNTMLFNRCSGDLAKCFDGTITSSISEFSLTDPGAICGDPAAPVFTSPKGDYGHERCMSTARTEIANISEKKARATAEAMAAESAKLKAEEERRAERIRREREAEDLRKAEEEKRLADIEERAKEGLRIAQQAAKAASAAESEKIESRRKLREEIAKVGPKQGNPTTESMSTIAATLGNAYRKSGTAGMLLVEENCWKKASRGDEFAFTQCVKFFGVLAVIDGAKANQERRPINYGVAQGKIRVVENGQKMGFAKQRIDDLMAWVLVDYEKIIAAAMSTGL